MEITCGEVMKAAMAWYDQRTVYMISTIHPPVSDGEQSVVLRHAAGGAREAIPCPPAQYAYQEFMGGVDLADQILQSFSVIRKSSKAWKKLFYYGLAVCLLNVYVIFKAKTGKQGFPKLQDGYRLGFVRGQMLLWSNGLCTNQTSS